MQDVSHIAFQRDTEYSASSNTERIPGMNYLLNRECHKMLWASIFSNYTWLNDIARDLGVNLILIGIRLDTFYQRGKDTICNSAPAYIALISRDISGDVTYIKDLFFSSLKSHKYVESTAEIMFNSGITLNIADILYCPELIPVDTQKLLYKGGKLYSTYSF